MNWSSFYSIFFNESQFLLRFEKKLQDSAFIKVNRYVSPINVTVGTENLINVQIECQFGNLMMLSSNGICQCEGKLSR